MDDCQFVFTQQWINFSPTLHLIYTNRIREDLWVTEKWRVHCTLDEVQLSSCVRMHFPLKR